MGSGNIDVGNDTPTRKPAGRWLKICLGVLGVTAPNCDRSSPKTERKGKPRKAREKPQRIL